MKNKKNQGGFTLIELIVVIAVIGILAAVMLPKYAGFTASAEKSNVLTEAKYIATAVEALKIENNGVLKKADTTGTVGLIKDTEIMTYVGKDLGGEITDIKENGNFKYTAIAKKSQKKYTVNYVSEDKTDDKKSQTFSTVTEIK